MKFVSTCNPRTTGLALMVTDSRRPRVTLCIAILDSGCSSVDPTTQKAELVLNPKRKRTTTLKNF